MTDLHEAARAFVEEWLAFRRDHPFAHEDCSRLYPAVNNLRAALSPSPDAGGASHVDDHPRQGRHLCDACGAVLPLPPHGYTNDIVLMAKFDHLRRERDEARAALSAAREEAAELREAGWKCLSTHEDIGCSCNGCASLRRALAPHPTPESGETP